MCTTDNSIESPAPEATPSKTAEQDTNKTVRLTSSDGKVFCLSSKIAKLSSLIADSMDSEDDDNNEEMEIPLPKVDAKTMEKVIEFGEHYVQEPMKEWKIPIESSNMEDLTQKWYADFSKMPLELLYSVMLAANYLDIKPLLNLGCAKVASKIRGRVPEEIRKEFGIVNDLTEEDERRIIQENQWCESP